MKDTLLDKATNQGGYLTLQELPQGEFFKKKHSSKKVWVKEEYYRPEKKYQCGDFEDIGNAIYLHGSTMVFVDFEF